MLKRRGTYVGVNYGGGVAANNGWLRKSLRMLSATPTAAGSGYAVGDTITLSNGTHAIAAVLKVASLTSGGTGVATVSVTNVGDYSSFPTGAGGFGQASTSGTGTGATFNGVPNYGKAAVATGYGDASAGPLFGVPHDSFGGGVMNGSYCTVTF